MNPFEPTERWHPPIWSHFKGKKNRRAIDRLQRDRVANRTPPSILIIGPYGAAKTALGRFTMMAYCCSNVTEDGNPCHRCDECLHQGRDTNGSGDRFVHYEIDCTRLTKQDVIKYVEKIDQRDEVASFWDELHRLRERDAMECLLTPVNDARGLFIAAIMDDHVHTIPPPLFERFRKVWLAIPTENEFVEFFHQHTKERNVATDLEIIHQMVRRTERSFRRCLDLVEAAAANPNRTLDLETIDEFLSDGVPPLKEVVEDDDAPEDVYDDDEEMYDD